jgi:hypothetical protein
MRCQLLRFACGTLAVVVLASCLCSDELVTEVPSPDRALTAAYFVRDCGATTDFVTAVSVRRGRGSYKDRSAQVFVVRGRHKVSLAWTGPRTLVVECSGCERKDVVYQVTVSGDLSIKCLGDNLGG